MSGDTTKKVALHFGAGNIGRGFIGAILSQSGFHVVFADVQEELVNAINKDHQYPIHILGEETKVEKVENVSAVSSTDLKAFEKLGKEPLSIITTAVGPKVLPKLAKSVAAVIKSRKSAKMGPINIVACENIQRATDILRDEVLKGLNDEERQYAQDNVGFPVCTVDRIVPPFDSGSGNILDVGVEPFYEWIVDKKSLKKTDPDIEIKGMITTENLDAYIQRKLFIFNCAHAILAFLGAIPATPPAENEHSANIPAHPTILESIDTPVIHSIVTQALEESSAALVKKHGFTKEQENGYVKKILERVQNPNLKDEVARVGREPLRKLKKGDRLLGPIEICRELGLKRDALLIGVAAALLFDPAKKKNEGASQQKRSDDDLWEEDVEADEEAKDLHAKIAEKGVDAVVQDLTGWGDDDEDLKAVLKSYESLSQNGLDEVGKKFTAN